MKCRYKISLTIFVLTVAVLLIPGTAAFALFQEEELEEAQSDEEYEAYMEQYNAYTAATEEPDLVKRGDMFIEFMETYPESELLEPYVLPAYPQLLFSCYQGAQEAKTDEERGKKYQELEILAEKWLELFPDNLQTIGLAATAADQLNHDEKSLKYLLLIYETEPTVDRTLAVAQTYDKLDNFEKYIEWIEKVFNYPEYSVDYTLRFDLVLRFAAIEDIDRASTYAAKTLETLDAAEQPDAAGQENMLQVRNRCHHIIALKLYGEEKYKEAIESFENALKVEKYQEGFYYIGQCYWRLTDPKQAHDYFAAAELMGGELTEQAKEYKEELYKPLHNKSLVGIEKVHKRAQAILDSFSDPDIDQKKTELSSLN